jgi:microcystin-dependent protein
MEVFIGTIMPWPVPWCPQYWHFCDGSLLNISEYSPLYALIGTTYGGDGVNKFGIPDLRCRMPLGRNNGATISGLTTYPLGAKSGAEVVTLTTANMPSHTHAAEFTPSGNATGTLQASTATANTTVPTGNYLANGTDTGGSGFTFENYVTPAAAGTLAPLAGLTITGSGTITNSVVGGGQATTIMPPFLVLNYIIALEGIFPSRQ